jgi:hypothetical protein
VQIELTKNIIKVHFFNYSSGTKLLLEFFKRHTTITDERYQCQLNKRNAVNTKAVTQLTAY